MSLAEEMLIGRNNAHRFPLVCRTPAAVCCFRLIQMVSALCKTSTRSSTGVGLYPELVKAPEDLFSMPPGCESSVWQSAEQI